MKHHRFFTNQNLQSLSNDTGGYVAILDLANPWVPNTKGDFKATVSFDDSTKQRLEEEFSVSLAPNISENLTSVDDYTTSYAFVFDDPSKVADFLSDGYSLGYTNASVTIDIIVPITQADCKSSISTGDYINYRRWQNSSGVNYDGSFTIHYTAPVYSTEDCNQGTITISDDYEGE